MKAKIQLFSALTITCLTSGCILPAPYPDRPVYYGAGVHDEFFIPGVVIVENGVRHDRYFYQRHPEYYRRDQLRYPERFAHMPPPRHDAARGPVPAVHVVPGRPAGPVIAQSTPSKDSKDKKKKHDGDRDHER